MHRALSPKSRPHGGRHGGLGAKRWTDIRPRRDNSDKSEQAKLTNYAHSTKQPPLRRPWECHLEIVATKLARYRTPSGPNAGQSCRLRWKLHNLANTGVSSPLTVFVFLYPYSVKCQHPAWMLDISPRVGPPMVLPDFRSPVDGSEFRCSLGRD